ncbi:hypothetical protein BGZ80_002181 [Entomortierella chlamydospora]|uniref:FAD-binding domain-containing protein n=1 Tax=Entomortierella chlamydospora TaxID=101097 RepID=A0A9P6N1F0_9FUNG|nr:hypothetical protein BGZ79_010639 [Entomortierella chlamydospora]KAG0021547.1 hypothetical protein BGZ80_002181 [Entomortierella chlamydospora]
MSEHSTVKEPAPDVLIIGAGLGGLMLGIAFESAGISYHILERATELRSLGSAISISGNILPAFEQLGIYEELKKVSLPHVALDFYDTEVNKLGSFESKGHNKACGVDIVVTARPTLYELLRRRVPAHKISLGKKVLRTKEKADDKDKVTVYCSDNTEYECSIVVGADGAYSAVRQNMYNQLEAIGKLPVSDKETFSISYITMVGTSKPPNPEKYPELKDSRCHFRVTIGDKNESVPESSAKELQFRNSEWGPEAIESMLKDFEDFPCPYGGTMKDIFDATPKDLISKVFLEEKVFETWYHGRSVLIGDACHKMLPGAGQGAGMAMRDAIVLANCIYNMKDYSTESVNAAFASYYRQRFPEADIQFKNSANMAKIMFGQKWSERTLRYVMLNYTPYWLMQKKQNSDYAFRPQLNWLPLVEKRGTGNVLPYEGREEAAAKREAAAKSATAI